MTTAKNTTAIKATAKALMLNAFRALQARMALLVADESGMSTVEYAIGTIAAAAFGAILYTVVTGDSIVSALTRIIGRALNTKV
jgi:O-acetylhomoserine/O-acetylserine sulfhydrylase-like pyridoxal-dependent enzyme